MNEAMSKEDFERADKGLPPIKKPKIERPDPEFPLVKDLIKFDDIPIAEFDKIVTSNRRAIRNEEGVIFIGFDVTILLKPKQEEDTEHKVGRPPKPQPRVLKGWMIEGDFEKLRRQRIG
jgi:hypothetical protein